MRALLAFALLAGCSSGSAPTVADGKIDSHRIVPVADAGALTIAELKRKGLVQIDQHETSDVCGDNCIADGFDALYYGKIDRNEKPLAYDYICPVADGPEDAWKCRPTANSALEKENG